MLNLELVRGWTKGTGFVMDSGYYAGRGPSQSDLNPDILEMFYLGIKKDVGAEAAMNFVRFVNKLTDLSASAFIVAFERFAAQDGKKVDIEQNKSDGNRLTARGRSLQAQGFALIASVLGSPQRSDSENQRASNGIKVVFINKHLKDIPAAERQAVRAIA